MRHLARSLAAGNVEAVRAVRDEAGTRSFRIVPGEPLPTSFDLDLYDRVFGTRYRRGRGGRCFP